MGSSHKQKGTYAQKIKNKMTTIFWSSSHQEVASVFSVLNLGLAVGLALANEILANVTKVEL